MKKKKWFRLLKKQLKRFPKKERKEIIDYYEELFNDKYDTGMSEWQIIGEFGDPFQAVRKILTEDVSDAKIYRGGEAEYGYADADARRDFDNGYPRERGGNTDLFDDPDQRRAERYADDRRQTHTPPYRQPVYAAPPRPRPESRRAKPETPGMGKIVCTVILGILLGGFLIGIFFALWAFVVSIFCVATAMPVAVGLFAIANYTMIWSAPWTFALIIGALLVVLGIALLLYALGIGMSKLGAKLTANAFRSYTEWLQK